MRYGLVTFFLVLFAMTFGGSAVEAFMEIYGLIVLFILVGIGMVIVRCKEMKDERKS